eukprot:923017-Amphidinium_carterae.5
MVFSVLSDDGDRLDYLFMYALLNPQVCFYQSLIELPTREIAPSTLKEWDAMACSDFTRVWTLSDEHVQMEDPFAHAEEDYVLMFSECAMVGQHLVVAYGNLWPIAPAMRSENASRQPRNAYGGETMTLNLSLSELNVQRLKICGCSSMNMDVFSL